MLRDVKVDTLVGDRVTLRAWDPNDADWYVTVRDDAVFEFTTERPELTAPEVVEAIELARASDSTAAFAVDDEHGGLVGNLAIEITQTTAEVSYFIAPIGRRRGLATDAVRTAVQWLRSRSISEARAITANGNDASSALLTRIGFQPIGDVDHPRLGPSKQWAMDLTTPQPSPGSSPRTTS